MNSLALRQNGGTWGAQNGRDLVSVYSEPGLGKSSFTASLYISFLFFSFLFFSFLLLTNTPRNPP